MKLYIVNDYDCPSERMLAEEIDGALWYIDSEKREHYPRMLMSKAVPVEDFGVTIDSADGAAYVSGHVRGPSVATYSNGKPRRWQGSDSFVTLLKHTEAYRARREGLVDGRIEGLRAAVAAAEDAVADGCGRPELRRVLAEAMIELEIWLEVKDALSEAS